MPYPGPGTFPGATTFPGVPTGDDGTGTADLGALTVAATGIREVVGTALGQLGGLDAQATGVAVASMLRDLNLSLYAVDPDTGQLSALPDGTLTLSPERNGAGSLTLRYPVNGTNFDLLRSQVTDDRDLEVEIWSTGSPTGAMRGYLQEAAGDDVADEGQGVWTFAGGFLERRTDEAVVFPQPDDPKHELRFASATPGEVVEFIMDQAQDRGALTDIAWDFTDTHDSAGTPWPQVISTKFSPGATYTAVLGRLVAFGLAEWAIEWTGTERVLRLWVPEGRGADLTVGPRPVVLRRGRNVLDAPRKWSVREAGTAVLAIGAEGVYDDVSDPDAQTRRGRRIERSVSANNLADPDALALFAARQLDNVTTGVLEVDHGIGFLPGEPRPRLAFDVGDWVYSQTGTELERLRVVQWTLTVSPNANPEGTVTLNDTVRDALQRLQAQLAAALDGDTVIGTSQESQPEDTGVPLAPDGVVVGSDTDVIDGTPTATVTVGWLPVTHNTDGTTATDINGYRIQYRYAAQPDLWIGVEDVGPQQQSASFLATPETEIGARVAAYDRNGNVSDWSDIVDHTTAAYLQPPPATSTPEATDWLGTGRIRWDGNTASGTLMQLAAPAFRRAQVHISQASNFTPTPATQVGELRAYGTISVVDLPYNVEHFVRLVAEDVRGNPSPPSAQASFTPRKLVNIDFGPESVERASIKLAAIGTAQIADLAVNDAKIANLAVGKLTSGSVTADMILSTGEIRSGDDPNNYTVQDTAGIRMVFNGQIRVQFDRITGDALITGTYRSALSGERINLLPDGTFRLYGASGSDYAEIANDGGVVRFRSRANTDGRRSYADFNPAGMKVWYGTRNVNGTVSERSKLDLGLTYGVITAPVTGVRILSQLAPDDGTENRFHFVTANSGGDIADSVLHYSRNTNASGSGTTGPALVRPTGAQGSGIHFANDLVVVTFGDGNNYVNIDARDFRAQSSERSKREIGPIRHPGGLSSLDVVERVGSYRWQYDWEAEHAPAPRLHFFPIAEQLQRLAPDLVQAAEGGDLAVGLRDTVGLLWDAVQLLSRQVRVLRGVTAPIVTEHQVLDPSRWAELPPGPPRGKGQQS